MTPTVNDIHIISVWWSIIWILYGHCPLLLNIVAEILPSLYTYLCFLSFYCCWPHSHLCVLPPSDVRLTSLCNLPTQHQMSNPIYLAFWVFLIFFLFQLLWSICLPKIHVLKSCFMGFYLFFDKFVHVYSVSWSSSLASITFCPAIPFLLDCFLFLTSSSLTTMSFSHAFIYLLVGNTSTMVQLRRWEDTLWQLVLSLHHDVLEIKLRLLGLVTVLLPIETSAHIKAICVHSLGFI